MSEQRFALVAGEPLTIVLDPAKAGYVYLHDPDGVLTPSLKRDPRAPNHHQTTPGRMTFTTLTTKD